MQIRKADSSEIDGIMALYDGARRFMAQNGNPNQWVDYPSLDIVNSDIKSGKLYVFDSDGTIVGAFYLSIGRDPEYEESSCFPHSDKDYAVIHRIASSGKEKGILYKAFEFALTFSDEIRLDTYKDNKLMQKLLSRYGFEYLGDIHIAYKPYDFMAYRYVRS